MQVDSDSIGYLVKCVFIRFGVKFIKITFRRWLRRGSKERASYSRYEVYLMFNNPNLDGCFKTNTARLAIRFPIKLSSLRKEKPRRVLVLWGRRTTGNGADVCGEEKQSLLLVNWLGQDTGLLIISWKFPWSPCQPFTPESIRQPRVYFYSKAKMLPQFVWQNPGQHSTRLWEKLGSFFLRKGL